MEALTKFKTSLYEKRKKQNTPNNCLVLPCMPMNTKPKNLHTVTLISSSIT